MDSIRIPTGKVKSDNSLKDARGGGGGSAAAAGSMFRNGIVRGKKMYLKLSVEVEYYWITCFYCDDTLHGQLFISKLHFLSF